MSTYWAEDYPPFPDDVPIAHLTRISLQKLLTGDQLESENLYNACVRSGFFIMDLRNCVAGDAILEDVKNAFDLSKPLFNQSAQEKTNYPLQMGTAYGHKAYGITKVDSKGTPDRCEFWGVSKDGIMGNTPSEPRPPVLENSLPLLEDLTRRSHALCMTVISHLEKHLHIPEGDMTLLHALSEPSNDQFRYMYMPPQPSGDQRCSFLPHTDFGSVSLVWNVLGGLQIHSPGGDGSSSIDEDDSWEWIRPEPGCVAVNMGDAMVKLSNNIIKSCLHRVAYPPGEQSTLHRYSLGYFSRPADLSLMEGLCAVEQDTSETHPEAEDRVYTMKEWVADRIEVYKKGGGQMRSWGGTAKLAAATAA